jgi:type IV pilus assembly protein PilW
MMYSNTSRQPRRVEQLRGFSLVEIMVGVAIGLIGVLILMQLFVSAERQRGTTLSGSSAQATGTMAAFTLERDIRMAGFGNANLGCASINGYNTDATPKQFALPGTPVTITQNTPSGTSNDQIEIIYSSSAFAAIPATVQADMATSSPGLNVDAGIGFNHHDLVIISQPPKVCSLVQLSGAAEQTTLANVTGHGTQWSLPHNPLGNPYNPPSDVNIFPTGGYMTGAKVLNFGKLNDHLYYVENNKLVMKDRMAPTGANNPVTLPSDVVALRAAYGLDTDDNGSADSWSNTTPTDAKQLIAVRYALVVRSSQYEKEEVTPADSLILWEGGPTVALRSSTEADINNRDTHYRYKIYQTIVPLRNVIWGKA